MKSQTFVLRHRHIAGVVAFALLLIAAPAARAQNEDIGNISVDYSYLRANSSGSGGTFSADGGTVLGGFAIMRPLSIAGEIEGYTFRGQPAGTSGQMFTYTFGPELQVPIHDSRLAASADVLFGGGYLRGEESGQTAHENAFVMSIGVGLIANVRDRWSIEMIKVKYISTGFQRTNGEAGRQNDMQISAGFIFNIQRRSTYR